MVLVDGCMEPTADVLTPLAEALKDSTVGVTGPFGIVTVLPCPWRPVKWGA